MFHIMNYNKNKICMKKQLENIYIYLYLDKDIFYLFYIIFLM